MSSEDRTALVTGSTSGIGLAVAKSLLANGFVVYFNYHADKSKAEKIMLELSSDRAYVLQADVSDENQVANMMNSIRDSFGRLDVLINNAGISINEPIGNISAANIKKVLDVNLVGKMLCTRYAVPLLKISKTPRIINIASRLGVKPCEGASAYCASAAAIINFTQACSLELSKYGIIVNSVSPGLTVTPLTLSKWSTKEMDDVKCKVPLGRLGETNDITTIVNFLVSEDACYINGENINVSGGLLLT